MTEQLGLTRKSATEVVERLRSGEITPMDTLDALEARVAETDPAINALPTLCFDRARDHARRLKETPPDHRGVLCGMPVAVKDLTAVAGVRTTQGSKLHENDVPDRSDRLIEAIEARGGIIYAKSNTPEFGVGGNTFNDVFGPTRNPYDRALSAGGSSGGAAAALAVGSAWLATGSDLGGSVRTPASFCGIASLRPAPWLIEADAGPLPFQALAFNGPMARDVRDVALLAEAMANGARFVPGQDLGFCRSACEPARPVRIAYSADLGLADTDSRVRQVCSAAIDTLARDGSTIEETHPDLAVAHDAFWSLRAVKSAITFGDRLERIRDIVKPELTLDVERGLRLTGADIRGALAKQGQVVAESAKFMSDFDLLICPAAIIPPFPVEDRYPGHDAGVPLEHYLRWLEITYAITTTALPVITVPCGKTADGLPIGLQLVGKPYGELNLFAFARHVEQVIGWDATPIDPR